MHYFVYLARLHEPLAKHEKNLVSAAKSLNSSHMESFRGGGLSPRVRESFPVWSDAMNEVPRVGDKDVTSGVGRNELSDGDRGVA